VKQSKAITSKIYVVSKPPPVVGFAVDDLRKSELSVSGLTGMFVDFEYLGK
jgi:hypothetical protein